MCSVKDNDVALASVTNLKQNIVKVKIYTGNL